MTDGYRPHASYITKTLILTFTMGVAVGIAIGWGAKSSWHGDPVPLDVATTTPTTPVDGASAVPPASDPAVPDNALETVAVETPAPDPDPPAEAVPSGPFDPDVTGRWPAAHLFVGIAGTKADVATLELLNEFKPGGVVLGPENVVDSLQLSALILQIKQAVGLGTTIADPPVILYTDDHHALPHLIGESTTLAADAAFGPDTVLAAVDQAREARNHGIGVFIAPSLDIRTPTTIETVAARSLGDNVAQVSERGLSVADRLRGAGVLPVASLFPGGGLAVTDESGLLHIPAQEMDGLAEAMQPFKAAMDGGIPGILVGLMAVPGIDTDRPNRPAALSPRLLQVLVREEWGYTGVLLADDITRNPMTRDLPRDEIALKALVSGCDAVILRLATRSDLRQICDTYVRLSERSDFPVASLAESRERLQAWRDQLGKSVTPDPTAVPPVEVAKEIPTETITTPVTVAPIETAVETAPDTGAPVEKTPAPETDPADVVAEDRTVVATEAEAPIMETPSALPTQESSPAEVAESILPPTEPEIAVVEPPEAEVDPVAVEVASDPAPATPPAMPEVAVVEHTIQKGDSLIAIANRYNVTTDQLKAWNNLKDETIKYGRKLKVQAPPGDGVVNADPAPASEKDAPLAEKTEEEAPIVEPAPAATADEPAENKVAAVDSVPTSEPAEAITVSEPEEADGKPDAAPQPANTDRRTHVVAAGETPDLIALAYGVDVAALRTWNGLSAEEADLVTGQSIVIYLPFADAPTDEEAPVEEVPVEETPAKAPTAEVPAGEAKPREPAPGTYEIYEVSPGDNLRRIALRFGTTQQTLIEWNNIKEPDHVQLGWKLKVPKQPAAADNNSIEGSEPTVAPGSE